MKRRLFGYVLIPLAVFCLLLGGSFAYSYRSYRQTQHEFQQGLNALQVGDWQQVQVHADKLRKQAGFEMHGHLLQGGLLLRTGRPVESLEQLSLAVEHEETRLWALVLAGEALCQLKQYGQAQEVLRQALGIDPSQADAHRWIAVVYYDLGAMDHAVHHLEKLAELVPTDPRPHRLMGLIHKDLEAYKLAVLDYEESLRRSRQQPDIEEVLVEMATVQVKLGQFAEALQTLSECPSSAEVATLQAECYYNQGRQDRAEELLDQVLAEQPDQGPALLLQGTLFLDAGQPELALPPLQRAVELNAQEFTAHFKLSQAYSRLQQADKAAFHLEETNRIKQLRKEFSEVYEQALEDTRDADLRFRLAMLATQLNRPELAEMWLQAALSIDPNHVPARQALQSWLSSGENKQ